MNTRLVMLAGAALLLAGLAGGGYVYLSPAPAEDNGPENTDDTTLPLPPVSPRIAEGGDYDRCLTMVATDPAGVAGFVNGMAKSDGATQCLALSEVALGDPASGAQLLENLAASSTAPAVNRATIYDQATQAWIMIGNGSRAFATASQAIALLPDDTDPLVDHAVAAGQINRFDDAIADLTRALQIEPKRADALTDRAADWRQTNHLDRAQADIDRALAIDPDSPDALLERGIIRQRANDRDGAQADWQRAIDLAPDSPAADLAEQNLALLEAGPDRK